MGRGSERLMLVGDAAQWDDTVRIYVSELAKCLMWQSHDHAQ